MRLQDVVFTLLSLVGEGDEAVALSAKTAWASAWKYAIQIIDRVAEDFTAVGALHYTQDHVLFEAGHAVAWIHTVRQFLHPKGFFVILTPRRISR